MYGPSGCVEMADLKSTFVGPLDFFFFFCVSRLGEFDGVEFNVASLFLVGGLHVCLGGLVIGERL